MKTYRNMTEQALISLILKKDNHATGELYSRYYKKVYQKCLTLVKDNDEALDLAEESLMKAFEKLDAFKGASAFGTWLYTITHRHCLGYLRRKNKSIGSRAPERIVDANAYSIASQDEFDAEDPQSIMLALIDNMPRKEKELLLLKYYQGESIESLQHQLNLSASAVKMRLKRSKEKLNYLYTIALTSGLASALTLL
jgi:RNA polymerase sigma-70 factor, ECF subfamily